MIPSNLRALFWDTDLNSFNPAVYPDYTVFRVLEHGDEDAVAWLRKEFSPDQICAVLRTERRLSKKSATFWALVYGIPAQEVAALKEGH
jgi:Family of unknown function (DUF6922)